MSRRSKPEKRIPAPDPIYNNVDISKFINRIMRRGKKSLAENTKNGVKYEAVLADINKELEKSIEKNEAILTDTDSIYQTDGEDFSGYYMPDFSNPDEYQI